MVLLTNSKIGNVATLGQDLGPVTFQKGFWHDIPNSIINKHKFYWQVKMRKETSAGYKNYMI